MLSLRRLGALALLGTGAALAARRRRVRYSFSGRVAVVTGGSRGLGLCMARELAKEGATLVLLARDAEALRRAREELEARGARVLAIPCDVREPSLVAAAMARAAEAFGRIDVLVNDAGVIQVGPLEHMTRSDFEDAMATNFFGAVNASLAALPHMPREGRIVNISSIGGKIAVPHMLPYTASKFALTGFSDGLRAEVAKNGIRVTTVCPPLMRTGSPIQAVFKGDAKKESAWFAISDRLPLVSMSAPRAARKILEACRRGEPRLLLGWPTKAAAAADLLLPGTVAALMALAVGLILPGPTGSEGDTPRKGFEVRSPDRDSYANNELPTAQAHFERSAQNFASSSRPSER